MATVENKCTNCMFQGICRVSARSNVVIWKHCNKFKPTKEAIDRAVEQTRKERRARAIGMI